MNHTLLTIRIIAGITIGAALLVMIGWIFDIATLKSIVPGLVTMQFVTAFSFLISGVMLFSLPVYMQGERDVSPLLVTITLLAILCIMGLLIGSSLFGFQTGIETLSLGTITAFVLLAFSVFFSLLTDKGQVILHWSGIVLSVIGGIAIGADLLHSPVLDIALHTAVLFILLGIALTLTAKLDKTT